jgi:hypothetical protein
MGLRDWWRKREEAEDKAALEAEEKEQWDTEAERAATDIDALKADRFGAEGGLFRQ